MNTSRTAVILVAAATLAACATTPKRNEQLEAAHAEFDRLSQDPLAQQAAGNDVESARASLQQADDALHAGRPTEQVDQLAYLALRQAQAGEARVTEAHARQEVTNSEREREQVLLQARSREADLARNRAQQAEAQVQEARSQAQGAQQQLAQAQQELQQLRTKQTERGRVMTLSSDVLFDTGKSTLKSGSQRDLDRLAQFLKDSPQSRVIVEGFTDSRGSDDYNQQLSEQRAQAVAAALRDRGVPGDRVEARGMGKGFPVASNDTPAGRQQNRRVEIVMSDQAGRFAEGANADQAQRR